MDSSKNGRVYFRRKGLRRDQSKKKEHPLKGAFFIPIRTVQYYEITINEELKYDRSLPCLVGGRYTETRL